MGILFLRICLTEITIMKDTEKELTPIEDGNKVGEEKNKPEEKKSSEQNGIGFVEPELLDKLPPEAKKVVEMSLSTHMLGPMQNPLAKKITSKHIDKILDLSEKDAERTFKDAEETRKFTLKYVVLFVILFVFLTIFLVSSDKELYKEVIKLFAVFLGGFGSGFGIKNYMDRHK